MKKQIVCLLLCLLLCSACAQKAGLQETPAATETSTASAKVTPAPTPNLTQRPTQEKPTPTWEIQNPFVFDKEEDFAFLQPANAIVQGENDGKPAIIASDSKEVFTPVITYEPNIDTILVLGGIRGNQGYNAVSFFVNGQDLAALAEAGWDTPIINPAQALIRKEQEYIFYSMQELWRGKGEAIKLGAPNIDRGTWAEYPFWRYPFVLPGEGSGIWAAVPAGKNPFPREIEISTKETPPSVLGLRDMQVDLDGDGTVERIFFKATKEPSLEEFDYFTTIEDIGSVAAYLETKNGTYLLCSDNLEAQYSKYSFEYLNYVAQAAVLPIDLEGDGNMELVVSNYDGQDVYKMIGGKPHRVCKGYWGTGG